MEVTKEELKPVVREALTEDVLKAAKDLIGLTPTAIKRLEAHLDHEDPVIQQRAYTLVLKLLDNKSLMPQDAADDPNLVVHFNIPRPESGPQTVDVEAIEMRACDFCGKEKATTEFVGKSERCRKCHDEMAANARRILDGGN